MTTTTSLPTPSTVPHKNLRAARNKRKVRDDSQEEERQEKRQPSLNTMNTRLYMYLDGSHRSRGNITVARNKGSGKAARIGTVGDLKTHENVSRASNNNNDDDDGRLKTLESENQKDETSKNRNPGKMKVDPAFKVLNPTIQEFLQAQGNLDA
jgi:hypothetical protein